MAEASGKTAAAIAALESLLGAERVETGEAVRRQHAHATTFLATEPPDVVVFPRSTGEVSDIVRIAAEHGVPVIAYGTGTSLEGHVNAPEGGICIDLAGMNAVLAIHVEDHDVVVQPGVTRKRLNEELRATGLFFPIDPGADASLGGMAATRASGTNAVRYGTMKDRVLALEVVLADGRIIRTGGRARKSSAGYDLTRLFIGAEGTLGIITELTLRLAPIPEAISSARVSFPTMEAAGRAVTETIQMAIPVARIELMDALSVRAVNAYANLDLPEEPLLLLEFHGSAESVAADAKSFGEIAKDNGGSDFTWTDRKEDRSRLWQARHDAYYAMIALEPGADNLTTDVCVPISRLAEAVTRTAGKAVELGLTVPILGHAGDGNFHAIVLFDKSDAKALAIAKEFSNWICDLALELEGTCTGEHGIGQGKMGYLRREAGGAVDVMASVKSALDPRATMNPGKIVGTDPARRQDLSFD